MGRLWFVLVFAVLATGSAPLRGAAATPGIGPAELALVARHGVVDLPDIGASVDFSERYGFLDAATTQRAMAAAGVKPSDAFQLIGTIFPSDADVSPGRAWRASVSYRDTGYIPDSPLDPFEPADLLSQIQRADSGNIKSLGWLLEPHYDQTAHLMTSALQVQRGDAAPMLIYDVRKLTRKGVVSITFLARTSAIAAVSSAAADLGERLRLRPGSRYEDFQPDDRKADVRPSDLILIDSGVPLLTRPSTAKDVIFAALGLLAIGGFVVFVLRSALRGSRPRRTSAG